MSSRLTTAARWCSREMSMFSLVTALVSQHVMDELRNHKGLLSDLLNRQADVVCLQPTDTICLLQGDWENVKHAYMVLEEFYYKAQAQNAIQSMLTPAHGGAGVIVYDAEPALDYRSKDRQKTAGSDDSKPVYTSLMEDQSSSLDLSRGGGGSVKRKRQNVAGASKVRHNSEIVAGASQSSADCDVKYTPPEQNVVCLSDMSSDDDSGSSVGQQKRAATANAAPVVSTTTAIDGSSVDSCADSPMSMASETKPSMLLGDAPTDESVQRVLANMPSLANMFPQLLNGGDTDTKPGDANIPMWTGSDAAAAAFPTTTALKHQATADDDQPKQCGMCEAVLGSTTALQAHIIEVHAGRNHCCLYCSQTFVLYTDYVRHQKTHLAKYTCPTCGKVYRSDSRLREHTRTHDKDYVKVYHSCPRCGRLFTHKYNMQVHLKTQHFGWQTNRRYFCRLCGDKFAKPMLLREHEALKHNASPKRHRCSACGAVLSSYENLVAHRRTVHREDGNDDTNQGSSHDNVPA